MKKKNRIVDLLNEVVEDDAYQIAEEVVPAFIERARPILDSLEPNERDTWLKTLAGYINYDWIPVDIQKVYYEAIYLEYPEIVSNEKPYRRKWGEIFWREYSSMGIEKISQKDQITRFPFPLEVGTVSLGKDKFYFAYDPIGIWFYMNPVEPVSETTLEELQTTEHDIYVSLMEKRPLIAGAREVSEHLESFGFTVDSYYDTDYWGEKLAELGIDVYEDGVLVENSKTA